MAEVVVFGAGGYSGLELLRWLAWHPAVEVVAASSDQRAGQRVSEALPSYGARELTFTSHVETLARTSSGQFAFLATPAQTAAQLAPTLLERGLRVIDLSGAHRLAAADYPEWYGFEHPFPESLEHAVYGLPELGERALIEEARLVANPGCYATAAAVAAGPIAQARLAAAGSAFVVDGKSGTTGAGRSVREQLLHAEVADDVRPYRVGKHQHTPEMERTLGRVGGQPLKVFFTAHLVPMRRGLLCSVYVRAKEGLTPEELAEAFAKAYQQAPLVRVRSELPPETKRTLNSGLAEVSAHLDARTGTLAAFGAIDNLVKGAAGQAIQNLNIMLGLESEAGLLPARA
ncbi:MAG: N-acetyl-gamma-glutamyl-phosphate reductase [Myxococcota bacterium]